MKQRLFAAIPIPDHIKQELTKIALPDNFKITDIKNIHITLFFLGDTDQNKIPEITSSLDNAVKSVKSYKIRINAIGQFPPKGYPKIIYAASNIDAAELIKTADIIKKTLYKLGFKEDREFKYHITVARQKYFRNENFIMPSLNDEFIFEADRIVLYRSELKPSGPVYSEVWSGKFK